MLLRIGLICGTLGIAAALLGQQATPPAPGNSAQDQQNVAAERMHRMWPNLPPNQNPAAVARGKALFASNCSFCHGADASGGNGGPDLIRSVLVNHDEHGNLIGPTIHNGRPGKGMPAFSSFTDAQIDDLVAFLHQKNRDDRIRSSYKIGNVAVGDATAGKVYFQAHCAKCHSTTGDLAGIGKKYESGDLQQLWLDPGGHISEGSAAPQETVTVTLPDSHTFSGKLQHLDEFDVSFDDASGYHSFPIGPGVNVKVHNPFAAHEELLQHLTDTDMHNVTTYLETLK